jgi:Helix-turn-helix domain
MQWLAFSPSPEPYVDADQAAAFLSLSRKTLLALGRAGRIPGHPIGQGPRKIWRFRLTELSRWPEQETVKLDNHRGQNERNNS